MTADPDLRRSTPLGVELTQLIRRDGPIDVAQFMDHCLNDPVHGYYRTRSAIGSTGDFITAPEISQIFGELIGVWVAVVWQALGAPAPITLVELGPGRGTLMRDALRATRRIPGFQAALRVVLVESNASLAAAQRATLVGTGVPVEWSPAVPEPCGTAIVIANEFFDCLPVSQAVRMVEGWRSRFVGIDADGALQFVAGPLRTDLPVRDDLPVGTIVETADYQTIAAALGHLQPQLLLAIDYGDTPTFGLRVGDTLQAQRGHAFEHPLTSPGEADLTAYVDFGRLIAQVTRATRLVADGPVTQATFLGRLGAVERASRLMDANPSIAAALEAGALRLLAPAGMGGRFKCVGFRRPELPPLPGF